MDKGVAVQIGMIMILATLALAISLVYVSLKSSIDRSVELSHEDNIIHYFKILRFQSLRIIEGSPSSEIVIKSFRGSYSLKKVGSLEVNNTKYDLFSLTYSSRNFEVCLENSAIIVNSQIVEEPILTCNNSCLLVLPIIEGNLSFGGKSSIVINLVELDRCLYRNVKTIKINSTNLCNYFESRGFSVYKIDGDVIVNFQNGTDILVVRMEVV